MQVIAPAKINLSLRVLGRRSDGFHEIETLIAPISLSDEIKIEQRSAKQEIAFRCDDPSVPKGEDNIVVRAANVFFKETKFTSGISIFLKKAIPHGAGLGGGSSDAASTLLALNELFETNLPREALAKMAEMIGSDVPFFIFSIPRGVHRPRRVREPHEIARTIIGLIAEARVRRANAVGIRSVARLARNSRSFVRRPTVHSTKFCERSGAPCFRKIRFFGATENVVTQATRSQRCANVRLGFHGLRRDSRQYGCRSVGDACKSGARSGTVDVRVRNAMTFWEAREANRRVVGGTARARIRG